VDEKTDVTWTPMDIRTPIATTEMNARMREYSARVWPLAACERMYLQVRLLDRILRVEV
jgi:hypothetical protein